MSASYCMQEAMQSCSLLGRVTGMTSSWCEAHAWLMPLVPAHGTSLIGDLVSCCGRRTTYSLCMPWKGLARWYVFKSLSCDLRLVMCWGRNWPHMLLQGSNRYVVVWV